jgi:hypothetical protein
MKEKFQISDLDSSSYNDPRALIAEVYRQILLLKDSGKTPQKIFLHASHYQLVKWYRELLGSQQSDFPDYLGEYELFGIPIYAHDFPDRIIVE